MVDQRLVNGLVQEVGQLIEFNKDTIAYPWIGVIVNITSTKYADINVEGRGLLRDVPCHGIPEIGDSAIIHFIEGNYDMPVADCPKRLPPTSETLQKYYSEECLNFLDNGTFDKGTANFSGNFEIIKDESFNESNENACLLSENGKYIETIVDITDINATEFKFQCVYKGAGYIRVECFDNETNNIIQTLPYNLRKDNVIWENEYGREGWSYNKEVYPVTEDETKHKKIRIRLTNITESEEITIEDDDGEPLTRSSPIAMIIDQLLVYNENGDSDYHHSVSDVLESNEEN